MLAIVWALGLKQNDWYFTNHLGLFAVMPEAAMVVAAEAEAQGANDEVVVDLSGLASAWENDKKLRRQIARSKSLLTWICPKSVGVVTMKTLKLNTGVLMHLLRIYLPQAPVNKTCPVDYIYPEVARFNCAWDP